MHSWSRLEGISYSDYCYACSGSAVMTLAPGATLGPYQIEALAGAGAMGEVYRARDPRLNRTVALKVLPAHVASVPGLVQRFEREARAIAGVEHPNICPLYDVGADRGVNFLVMQFVEGETLADRIGRGPIPARDAVGLARQIAAGLDAAHAQGIVHRDLKPSNIRLTPDHQVKLVDFGLAKAMSPTSGGADAATQSATPSEAGTIVGTAAYMSPEQARGQAVDRRTDIWAFGCVLFEMLAGRRPFSGQSLPDVFAAIVSSDPDLRALPAATPRRVRDLIRRCLQKDPARRLRDIGDAAIELDDAASEPAEASGPAAARVARSGSAPIAWTVAVLAVVVAAAAWIFRRPEPPREVAAPMRFSLVTNFAGVEAQPSLSPDGRQVAFVSNRTGQWDLHVSLVTGGEPVPVTSDANVESRPRWSPDGTKLLYARLNDNGTQDIWVMSALGGPTRQVVANAFSPAWSAEGRIAYSSGNLIWMADADGANARAVTQPEPPPIFHDQPAFDHTGRRLVFIRRRLGPRSELALLDLDTSKVRNLTDDDALALSPVWSADDRFVFFSSSRGGTLNIWRLTLATAELTQITAGQSDDAELDVSGTRIVFSSYRANTNLAEISLGPATSGQRKWLTKDLSRSETAPRYSPTGGQITYFTNRSGAEREGIWVMTADGTNPRQLVEDNRRTNVYPRWGPDEKELIYYTRSGWDPDEAPDLRRIPVAGGAPQILPIKPWFPYWGWGDVGRDGRILYRTSPTTGEIFDPRTNQREAVPDLLGDPLWSDDGKSFAFAARSEGPGASGKPGLWIASLGGRPRQVYEGWVIWFAWDRDDKVLFLEGRPDLKGVLCRISPAGQKEIVLKELAFFRRPADGTWIARFDVHPDGRRIVVEGLENYESDIGMIEIGKQ
jgi:Tol biopolymer transport system component